VPVAACEEALSGIGGRNKPLQKTYRRAIRIGKNWKQSPRQNANVQGKAQTRCRVTRVRDDRSQLTLCKLGGNKNGQNERGWSMKIVEKCWTRFIDGKGPGKISKLRKNTLKQREDTCSRTRRSFHLTASSDEGSNCRKNSGGSKGKMSIANDYKAGTWETSRQKKKRTIRG